MSTDPTRDQLLTLLAAVEDTPTPTTPQSAHDPARVEAEETAAGLMLTLALAVVAVTVGLLVALTALLPLNGRHLGGVLLIVAGGLLAGRALWVAGKRAES